MKHTVSTASIAFLLSISVSGAAFAATKIGVVGASNPEVKAVGEDGASRALKAGDAIFLNDQIETTGKGSAQLMFLDKSALTVSPNSAVKIDKFVYDPTSKDGSMTIAGAKGAFRFIGGALTKKKPVTIKTPVSTIGIRGGIVDTHMTSDNTNAVFLYGDEMTMTNADGVTTTTQQFGTGLTIGSDGVPVNLPREAVVNLINSSPSSAAVGTTEISGSNDIDQKVNLTPKSDNSSDSGDDSNSGNSGNSGGSSGGSSNNGDGGNSGGGESNTASSSDSGNNSPLNSETGNSGSDAPSFGSNEAATGFGIGTTDATGNTTPVTVPTSLTSGANAQEELRSTVQNFVSAGGDANGDGKLDFNITNNTNPNSPLTTIVENRPTPPTPPTPPAPPTNVTPPIQPPVPPRPIGGGNNGNNGGSTPTPIIPTAKFSADPSRHSLSVEHSPQPPVTLNTTIPSYNTHQNVQNIPASALFATINNPDNLTLSLEPGSVHGTGSTIISATDYATMGGGYASIWTEDLAPGETGNYTLDYDVRYGTGANDTIASSITFSVLGTDLMGSTTSWNTTLPTTNYAALYNGSTDKYHGSFGFRDTSGTQQLEKGSWFGVRDHNLPWLGGRMLTMATVLNRTDGMGTIDPSYTAGDPDNVMLAALSTPYAAGYNYSGDTVVETVDGRENISVNQNAWQYITPGQGFVFYNIAFDDPDDMSRQFFRGYLVKSDIFNATDLTTARGAYNNILTATHTHASSLNSASIIEYEFLPDLNTKWVGGLEEFGAIDYNSAAGSGYTSPNPTGLLVNWDNKHYLGGHIDFTGANGSYPGSNMRVAFGKFKSPSDAVTSFNNSGFVQTEGSILDGSYYAIDQGNDFDDSGRSHLTLDAKPGSIGTNASGVIEGFVMDSGAGSTEKMRQPLVINPGAQNLYNPTVGSYNGYTGGITSNYQNKVSRMTNNAPANFTVNNTAGGLANATVTYREGDYSAGVYDTAVTRTVNFGSANNASIASGLYAAEASGTTKHTSTKGALVSMHEAVAGAQADLVCASCEFTHWGVWQADYLLSSTAKEKTALVPYIAGTPTTDAQITATTALLGAGAQTVSYSGDMVGNKTNLNGLTPVTNHIGNFNATIDLANRELDNFNGTIAGMNFATTTVNNFNSNSGTFGGVAVTNGASVSGTINGTLFGPEAQELGGNFSVKDSTTNDIAAGVYLGKR